MGVVTAIGRRPITTPGGQPIDSGGAVIWRIAKGAETHHIEILRWPQLHPPSRGPYTANPPATFNIYMKIRLNPIEINCHSSVYTDLSIGSHAHH